MRENKEERRDAAEPSYCEVAHLPGKLYSSCSGSAKEEVDGFLLCQRHALEAKLEGQIECWGGMLFHIDLWSREARRQKRPDVVGLLEDQRTQATSARQRAYEDLNIVRSEKPWERTREPSTRRRGPLLLLPPKAVRPLSRGLRRPRRR
jgi:hypothetical protein